MPKPTADSAEKMYVPARETRGARRRRETRQRLLEAALDLMARRGADGVTINEITEAADVGFGTFYNYFASKDEIYAAVTEWVFVSFADALDRTLAAIDDPAEIVSASIRHTLHRARLEPVWGRFLVREGLSERALLLGLATRLFRDISNGVAAGRFPAADPVMAFVSIAGAVLSAIVTDHYRIDDSVPAELAAGLAAARDSMPERAAAAILRILGLPDDEAAAVAGRPLPSWREGGEA